MTPYEFLLARITEDAARERADQLARFLDGLPDDCHAEATAAFENLYSTKITELNAASEISVWKIIGACDSIVARERAARYADHPDFQDEWRGKK